jgi:hypothetical protein
MCENAALEEDCHQKITGFLLNDDFFLKNVSFGKFQAILAMSARVK